MRFRQPCASGLAASLLFAGCAHYTAQPIAPAEQADAFTARALTDPQLGSFVEAHLARQADSWPPEVWDFDTLTLVALYFHPSLDVARARVQLADAQRLTAGEHPNPTLQTVPQYNTTSTDIPAWLLGTVFNFTIETAGKRGHRIARARHVAEAARWDVASTAWGIRQRLRAAFLELYAARRLRDLLEEQAKQQRDLVSLLEAERDAGSVTGAQVMRERILLNGQRLAGDVAREQAELARIRLADALGVSVRALEGIPFAFDELENTPETPPSDELRERALLNRPDVLGALATYAATESALELEIAKQYPDVTLGPGYEYDQGDNKWTLGLALPLPLFHQNQGPIAEAEARRRESGARFLELQARVIAQLTQASASLEARLEQQRDAAALVAELNRRERLVTAMRDAGELALEAVLAARLERIAGQLQALDAQLRAQQAIGELEDAMRTRMTLTPGVLRYESAETAREPSQ